MRPRLLITINRNSHIVDLVQISSLLAFVNLFYRIVSYRTRTAVVRLSLLQLGFYIVMYAVALCLVLHYHSRALNVCIVRIYVREVL